MPFKVDYAATLGILTEQLNITRADDPGVSLPDAGRWQASSHFCSCVRVMFILGFLFSTSKVRVASLACVGGVFSQSVRRFCESTSPFVTRQERGRKRVVC